MSTLPTKRKVQRAVCSQCKKPCPANRARIVINGQWWCPECVYLREHPRPPQ